MTGRPVASAGDLGNSRDPGHRRFDRLRGRGFVAERRCKLQHAVVGSQQHEVRRVFLQRSRLLRSSQGSGSSYSASVTSSRNLNRIAVPTSASVICEAVLADRISRWTGDQAVLAALRRAKFVGADFRIALILRPSSRRSASSQAGLRQRLQNMQRRQRIGRQRRHPVPQFSRRAAAARAGRAAVISQHGSVDTGGFSHRRCSSISIDKLAHRRDLFDLGEIELKVKFALDAAHQPDMREAVPGLEIRLGWCPCPITRSSSSSSARKIS